MSITDVGQKFCAYAGCKNAVPTHHFLCTEHYEDYTSRLIDQCPKCGRYKIAEYQYCSDCRFNLLVKKQLPSGCLSIENKPDTLEHSKTWEKSDKWTTQFFVYILKLDNGKFYIGQSNNLRARLSEHRDGQSASTKGLNPKLVYFEILPSRGSVERREAELKGIYDKNPRQVRRMVINFGDLVSEMEQKVKNSLENLN